MSSRTTSQQIALIFEIAGYLLLIPAAAALIPPGLYMIMFFFTLNLAGVVFCLIPFAIAGFGVWLLAGYRRHSCGMLEEENLWWLWIGTFLFNALPLAWFLVQFWLERQTETAWRREPFFWWELGWNLLATWWGAAIFLAAYAFYKDVLAAPRPSPAIVNEPVLSIYRTGGN